MPQASGRFSLILLALAVLAPLTRAVDDKLNFSRDVRPILSENCFACHGPDDKARKAKLRLDTREGAYKPHDGKAAIAPGRPDQSEAVRRILTTDPDDHMPPPDSGKKLTPHQVETLKNWIAQGADYTGHWSFQPIKSPPLPSISSRQSAIRNPIDAFILAKLQEHNLTLSPEAPRATLIRRLYFDLTGLPPTPAEVDAFVADQSPDAYEKLVDRLLASPRYGERMALDWLDAARYADTHGYHIDAGRDMTAWREWVIDAFNRNMPFDQFTVWQLAGDLLPNATAEQKIATGFHRNHMINFEGGAVPEEYHTAYLVDRVNTTATVWLGLTIACAQCHDHKYDPIKQREFYQFYAFFNNIPERGLDGNKGNAVPMIKTPTPGQQRKLDELTAQMAEAETSLDVPNVQADAEQAKWELTALATTNKTVWTALDPAEFRSAGNASLTKLEDKSIKASGANPARETYTVRLDAVPAGTTALRFETLADDSLPMKGPGRSKNGNLVFTELKVSAGGKPLKLQRASADFNQPDFVPANAIDNNPATGWAIEPQEGKSHHLIVSFAAPLAAPTTLSVVAEFQSIFPNHQPGRFRLSATGSAAPHDVSILPDAVAKTLALPAAQRTDDQRAELRRHYRTTVAAAFRSTAQRIADLRKSRKELEDNARTTMVMEEMPKPRETHILLRGQYDKLGDVVTADVPAALPPLPADAPKNRLGLARWIVSKDNPLTARVIVNRYWQAYFGTGIVKTAEDLGSQGEWPSHLELLDYLAARFIESGWDVKAMQRLLVTSATYRQSSRATPELIAADPENRLLARGPRIRLPAEFIRDQALAISGLLDNRIGGASVSPYQPAGLWEELMSREDGKNWTAQTYTQSHGADLYRRTMYTFWKRTSPPPTLSTFDAPDREVCTVRRARTNTPLQALVLMNDPTYLEASRKLAERLLTEFSRVSKGSISVAELDAQRLTCAFRLATGRMPEAAELDILRKAYARQAEHYRNNPQAAADLLKIGESPVDQALNQSDLAAWTIVSSIVLNLDETMTKN
jgi:hypothetical protein